MVLKYSRTSTQYSTYGTIAFITRIYAERFAYNYTYVCLLCNEPNSHIIKSNAGNIDIWISFNYISCGHSNAMLIQTYIHVIK